MGKFVKSALLTTSSASDVLRSGGILDITGLEPIKQSDIVTVERIRYKAEVSQVLDFTITDATVDLTSSITFFGSENQRESGLQGSRKFSYVASTGDTVTTIAAGLVSKINAAQNLYVTASNVAGAVTLTDDAGYFPARPVERGGKGMIKLSDNLSSLTLTETTAAVYEFGNGTTLAAGAPVIDAGKTGNLVSGEFDNPEDAVAGQFYDAFLINYIGARVVPGVSGVQGLKDLRQIIFVDNGTGASTANAAGFGAFLTEMERVSYGAFASDPAAHVSFLDSVPVYSALAKDGAAIDGIAPEEKAFAFDDASLSHFVAVGTAAPAYPVWSTAGLDLFQGNAVATEISAPVEAASPKQFIVGQQEGSFMTELTIATVANLSSSMMGLRKKQAYDASILTYTDIAAFNVEVGGGIDVFQRLNGAPVVGTCTETFADGETHVFQINVALDGTVTFLFDGVVAAGAPTDFVLDAGDAIIPFVSQTDTTDSGSVLSKWAFVPAVV